MRDKFIYNRARALPRMSWAPVNLYNLYHRSLGLRSGREQTEFTRSNKTLFQQRWQSKRLVRAYHGDYIGEKKFKKWYLPELIPDVRPRRPLRTPDVFRVMGREEDAIAEEKRIKMEDEKMAKSPVGSLMFTEIERRLDTIVFRCCFATSIYQARHLVLYGKVKLNGEPCLQAGKRLEPGDMITVDPTAIRFLYASAKDAPASRAQQKYQDDVEKQAEENRLNAEQAEAPTEESVDDLFPEATSETAAPSETAASESSDGPIASSITPPLRELDVSPNASMQGRYVDIPDFAAPFLFIPAYLEVSFTTCSAVYVRHPTARPGYSELPTPYDADGEVVRFAWEWYAKIRPRMRGKLQRETGPKGTRRPDPYWSQYQ